jgi:RNA polymerase sigma-70 factor (ECF subfamily)
VEEHRPRFEASREEREELTRRFFAAAREGDVDGLRDLLAEDVVLHGDGGGKVPALGAAIHGAAHVARTFMAWSRAAERIPDLGVRFVDVNGQPGVISTDRDGNVINVMTLDIADGRVQAIRSIVNPEKLGHLGQTASWMATLRGGDR